MIFLSLISITFINCGGGGGSGSAEKKVFDLSEYLIPSKVLNDDIVLTDTLSYSFKESKNGILISNSVKASYIKSDEGFTTYNGDESEVNITSSFYSRTLIKDKNIETITLDSTTNSEVVESEKRFTSLGQTFYNETFECEFINHYESLDTAEVLKNFLPNNTYSSNLYKTYKDVLEIKCIDSNDKFDDYIYYSKDIGVILGYWPDENTDGSSDEYVEYLSEQKYTQLP